MRRFWTAFIFLLAVPAFVATAQEDVRALEQTLPLASLSDTEDALPDWYRNYTQSEISLDNPLLRADPDKRIGAIWSAGNRLSFNFNLQTRADESPLPRDEMTAGATFKITPRFSVGGSVSVEGNNLSAARRFGDQEIDTGVRLESAFKF